MEEAVRMKIIDVKASNQLNNAVKPGPVDLIQVGRQCGKSFMIDQMINNLYKFTMPGWVVLCARRRNDEKAWWKRFTG